MLADSLHKARGPCSSMEAAEIRQGQLCGSLSVQPVASPSIFALRLAKNSLQQHGRARRSFAPLCPAFFAHLSSSASWSKRRWIHLDDSSLPGDLPFASSAVNTSAPLSRGLPASTPALKMTPGDTWSERCCSNPVARHTTALNCHLLQPQRNVCHETCRYNLILR